VKSICVLAAALSAATSLVVASPAAAAGSPAPIAVGATRADGSGGTAVRLASNALIANSNPAKCPSGETCGYEGANYGGSFDYGFYPSFDNFGYLEGSCLSLDYGFSFNDCTQSVWNAYGKCNGADWYFNANYGGTNYKNNDGTGTKQLPSKYADEFSSVVDCGY
jgi:hypothetical protein